MVVMIVVLVGVLVINAIVTVNIFCSDDSGDGGCDIEKYDNYSKYMW